MSRNVAPVQLGSDGARYAGDQRSGVEVIALGVVQLARRKAQFFLVLSVPNSAGPLTHGRRAETMSSAMLLNPRRSVLGGTLVV